MFLGDALHLNTRYKEIMNKGDWVSRIIESNPTFPVIFGCADGDEGKISLTDMVAPPPPVLLYCVTNTRLTYCTFEKLHGSSLL